MDSFKRGVTTSFNKGKTLNSHLLYCWRGMGLTRLLQQKRPTSMFVFCEEGSWPQLFQLLLFMLINCFWNMSILFFFFFFFFFLSWKCTKKLLTELRKKCLFFFFFFIIFQNYSDSCCLVSQCLNIFFFNLFIFLKI